MRARGLRNLINIAGTLALGACVWVPEAAERNSWRALDRDFAKEIKPLVKQYCLGCHSTEKQKGDLDLERFKTIQDLIKTPKPWEQVVEQLSLGEMPPKEKPQPTAAERERLLSWVHRALDAAAQARAGDPGPVVLRRLNNAEFTYTIRDLTGVETLDPAREFPADSAAGEGFMNTGNALVMSPSLLAKYLDAGKAIAHHAVLLPDGFRFSEKTSRRDLTEEILAEIRQLYRRYTDPRGAEKVNLQGIVFDTNEGGRLPVERYLAVTLSEREALRRGGSAFEQAAAKHGLNARYLQSLWTVLNSPQPSPLLDGLRARWRTARPEDTPSLVNEISQWQKALWKFSSVGHIGKAGGPKAWLEPVNPITTKQEVRLKLTAPPDAKEVTLYLVANDAGDGHAQDYVVWEQPRLIVPGRPNLLLRDARDFIAHMTDRRQRLFASTAKCLAAAAEASQATTEISVTALAEKHGVDADALSAWLDYLGMGASAALHLAYFKGQLEKVSGYDFVKGWGSPDTPSIVANSSGNPVRIPGNMKPHGVCVHPSPQLKAAIGWQSPVTGPMRIEAEITHAHPECGNGVEWFLELRRGKTRQRLAKGVAQGANKAKAGPIENVSVQKGDLVSLLIGPRDGNHACDLTDLEFRLNGTGGPDFEWSVTRDVSPDILAGNPHGDRLGNANVWHFYTEPVSGADSEPLIPSGSLLARWQSAASPAEKQSLAEQVQALLLAGPPDAKNAADADLYRQLASLGGPLFAGARNSSTPGQTAATSAAPLEGGSNAWALDAASFGRLPNGSAIAEASLGTQAPSVIEIRLPADLVNGAEFVTTGVLHPQAGAEGSVQLQITTTKPAGSAGLVAAETKVTNKNGAWTSNNREISFSTPIVANVGSAARKRIEAAFEEFRQWFPAALCYVKIVPVDEVVTLTLFYREDHHLVRLMLNETERAKLDRLWDELHYVSHDALTLVDAYEQLWQYATQDADPKVFEPMRQPIYDRAAAFRKLLLDTQPEHMEALVDFAARAYRRPLKPAEKEELLALYGKLRAEEISHEDAFRLTLARVFVSPSFLYRIELAPPGKNPAPVSDFELASRLSYFLWSSSPDAELLDLAAKGRLRKPDVLVSQARRMLRDPRVRRLSVEFACAWLHIHDFESLDEKSERHFPGFAALRGPMYEEAIRFFTDAFQRDASVLEFFDTDHTFVNEALAKHYGISGVTGEDWRRVDGVKKFGRGGVLGLSAVLAKQSGASRTSPILRGNWVSEVLLGEKLPRPPKDVPQLPQDEATETLTVRQLTEKHSSDPRCAGCHKRIDGYGFALEGFDAIGAARTRDLAGRPIETAAEVFDGTRIAGADGLRRYLLTQKRDVIVRQFCRKLLGYALGRGVMLSDKPLIAEMESQLRKHDYRFSAALETIVRSRQFREIRGRDFAEE
jgi:hypothetical protein